jgi:hypothetical protein
MQYLVGERVKVTVDAKKVGVDHACREAIRRALIMFGVDEDGHFENVEVYRNAASVRVVFVGYSAVGGMSGWSHVYEFSAWVESSEE